MTSNDENGPPPNGRTRVIGRILQWTINLTFLIGMGLVLWSMAYVGRNWPTVFVGVVLVGVCVALAPHVLMQLRLRRRGLPAEGVVEHVRSKMAGTGNVGAKLFYTATVRFVSRDGVERRCDAPARPTTQLGEPYRVYYDAREPSRAAVRDSLGYLLVQIVLLLVFLGATSWFLTWVATGGWFE